MTDIDQKKQDDDKKVIDSALSRVSGALQVAGIAVSEAISIKAEALDDVEALKTESDTKVGDHATEKIKKDTKKILGKSK